MVHSMSDDDVSRMIGSLQARMQGHDDWINSIQNELREVSKKQDAILEALAERRGIEKASFWMIGCAAALGGSTATIWLKKIFGA